MRAVTGTCRTPGNHRRRLCPRRAAYLHHFRCGGRNDKFGTAGEIIAKSSEEDMPCIFASPDNTHHALSTPFWKIQRPIARRQLENLSKRPAESCFRCTALLPTARAFW